MQFTLFFCFLVGIIASYAGERTGNLDDEQVELVSYTVSDLSSPKQTKILTLGLIESAITKLNRLYPQLDIIALDSTTYSSHLFKHLSNLWKSEGPIAWENQYDAIVIYLALEKNPYREQKLRIMYKALKPGKQGIIICAPKGIRSMDYWIEHFVEDSEWKSFVSNTPNLSPEDYRTLIQNIGFHIVYEGKWLSVLRNVDTFDWIGNRWAVPLPMQSRFTGDFYRFLRTAYGDETCWFPDIYRFVVEK